MTRRIAWLLKLPNLMFIYGVTLNLSIIMILKIFIYCDDISFEDKCLKEVIYRQKTQHKLKNIQIAIKSTIVGKDGAELDFILKLINV